MKEDEFRAVFNAARRADGLLFIDRADGEKGIAVGLRAGSVVLHLGDEIPLERLELADLDSLREKPDAPV